jgi:ribonuclease D
VYDARQMAALKALYEWRDGVARKEDESAQWVLLSQFTGMISHHIPGSGRKSDQLLEKSRYMFLHESWISYLSYSNQESKLCEISENQREEEASYYYEKFSLCQRKWLLLFQIRSHEFKFLNFTHVTSLHPFRTTRT